MVSVVVAARNEFHNLKDLVPTLLSQNYPNYEVIISLDRTSDQSIEYLNNVGSSKIRFADLQEIPRNWNSKKFAIKKGIELAKGDWILLTDADCTPSNNWIKEMSKGMTRESGLVLGLSPYNRTRGLLNQLIQLETFYTSLEFMNSAIKGRPYMGLGRNMAYRKSLFEQSFGFDGIEYITGGDDDLLVQKMSNIAGCRVILSNHTSVESKVKNTWSSYMTQKTRHFSVGKYYPQRIKYAETFRWSMQILFWILFTASFPINPQVSLLIFASYYLIKIISINIVADRMEKRFNLLWLPFVDLVYSVILPIISIRSLLIKNIKWN